ncbi:MAG TPA: hypothetical protein VNR59_09825 [Gaiellaceae bacterium]|nr:hypothetical protein [Gaiellaceae bacterium]
MKRLVLLFIACGCAAAAFAVARPATATASWCWPTCSTYGFLGQWTSTYTGCWYATGEVCSYYGNWFNIGVAKTCYPGCDWNYNTTGVILYGFENHDRIRGRFTSKAANTVYVRPWELGMSGLVRAQVTWYAGTSQINAAAIG